MGGDETAGDETAADETAGDTEGGSDDGPSPNCGNGVIDDDETCDGDDFAGATCADFGGETGELSCNACQIDSSACALLPATQFGDGASWSLPNGGDGVDGFYNLSGSEWGKGDESWSTADLTGDGLPDLVITNRDGEPILSGGDQYWWLYANTGSGFGEVTTWALPNGGDGIDGFYALGGSEWGKGDQSWSTVDLTGDGLPDLVITNQDGEPIVSGGDQYWWVHPNTGDGFGEATTWALPNGGDSEDGYYALGGSEWGKSDQSWSTMDLTGDGLPDLVITNQGGEPITSGGDQYWWVHPNTGSGFGEATTWALPNGGDSLDGYYAPSGSEWGKGDQSWSTVDLTGDGLPDLVITNQDGEPIVSGGDQYWWVHPNTGKGFGEATTWALPEGGDSLDGYYALAGSEWGKGDQSWTTLDITGDGRLDLVITNEDGSPIMSGEDQYWWLHANTGEGFDDASPWALPPGGDSLDGFYNVAGSEWGKGDQSWGTIDMTGDGRPDLMIFNEDGAPIAGPSWTIHPGQP